MTQEEKDLLLKDLSARLLYKVKGIITHNGDKDIFTIKGIFNFNILYLSDTECCHIEDFKPYLFPLSSITYIQKCNCPIGFTNLDIFKKNEPWSYIEITPDSLMRFINWCYKNHLDINGLIPKGLALDATGLNIY